MAILFNGSTLTGGVTDDFIFGHPVGGANHTLNGAGGDDLIFGDYDFFITEEDEAATFDTAANMTSRTDIWSTLENPDVGSADSVPHAAAIIEADGGFQWFRFDLIAGQRLTVDIDYGNHEIGSSFNSEVALIAANGTTIIDDDDTGITGEGGQGSTSSEDPYLSFTAATAGTYYIRVGTNTGVAPPNGATYIANFSLTGQTVTNTSPLAGNDVLIGGSGNDVIYGGGGNDTISGGDGVDRINAGSGNDILNGGASKDSILGGAGDDIFRVVGSDLGDDINGDSGFDTLDLSTYTGTFAWNVNLTALSAELIGNTFGDDGIYEVKSVENVTGSLNNDIITGSFGNNRLLGDVGNDTINGAEGNDTLNGGTGNDTMIGGLGNDRIFVDSATDVVVETTGQGSADTVLTTVNYTLAAGVQVEFMQTTSAVATTAIDMTGNELSQTIIGNAGVNRLTSTTGERDVLRGLEGDDVYVIANATDLIREDAGDGLDRVETRVSYTLSNNADIESLRTINAAATTALNLTGNVLAQEIIGNAGNNVLSGKLGSDVLTGNAGFDTFVFDTALSATTNVDTITDFVAGDDFIQLENLVFKGLTAGLLASSAYKFNTTGIADELDDRIIYNVNTGEIFYDTNGSNSAGSTLFAIVDIGTALNSTDFFVS